MRIIISIISLMILTIYSMVYNISYINTNISFYEIIYIFDKKNKKHIVKKENYFKILYKNIFKKIKKIKYQMKKYINFISYDKINFMVSLE